MKVAETIFTVAVCDFDRVSRKKTVNAVLKGFEKAGLVGLVCVKEYSETEILLKEHLSEPFSLIILPVESETGKEFAAAKKLCRLDDMTPLIFVSDNKNAVFRSFEFSPLAFVTNESLDPHNGYSGFTMLYSAIVRFLRSVNFDISEITFFCPQNKKVTVPAGAVIYISSYGHDVTVFTLKADFHISMTLKEVHSITKKMGFLRTDKGYIINPRCAKIVKGKDIVMTNGNIVPVSRRNLFRITQAVVPELGKALYL